MRRSPVVLSGACLRVNKSLFLTMSLLGFTTVSFSKGRAIRCSKRVAYVAFLLSVFATEFAVFSYRLRFKASGWNLTEHLKFFNYASRSFMIISCLVTSLLDRRQLLFWNRLLSIDARLWKSNVRVDGKYEKILTSLCCAVACIFLSTFAADWFLVIWAGAVSSEERKEWMWVKIRNFYGYALIFQFKALVFVLGIRFECLIREMKSLTLYRPPTRSKPADFSRRIRQIQSAHFALARLSQRLNLIMDIPGLFDCSSTAIVLICHSFIILDRVIPWTDEDVDKTIDCLSILYSVFWSAFVFGQAAALAAVCEFTSSKANQMGKSIHLLLDSEITEETKILLLNFSKLILHRKVRFAFAGVIELNALAFGRFIGLVLTYVVTLVQLKLTGRKVVTLESVYLF